MHINYVQIGPLYTSRGPLLAKHLLVIFLRSLDWFLLILHMMIDKQVSNRWWWLKKYFGLETSLVRVMTASLCVKTPLVQVFLSFADLNDLILHNMITLNGLNDFLAEADTFYKSFILFYKQFLSKIWFLVIFWR